jgi:hypothetical protein
MWDSNIFSFCVCFIFEGRFPPSHYEDEQVEDSDVDDDVILCFLLLRQFFCVLNGRIIYINLNNRVQITKHRPSCGKFGGSHETVQQNTSVTMRRRRRRHVSDIPPLACDRLPVSSVSPPLTGASPP